MKNQNLLGHWSFHFWYANQRAFSLCPNIRIIRVTAMAKIHIERQNKSYLNIISEILFPDILLHLLYIYISRYFMRP